MKRSFKRLNHVLIFEVVTKFVTELLLPILHK